MAADERRRPLVLHLEVVKSAMQYMVEAPKMDNTVEADLDALEVVNPQLLVGLMKLTMYPDMAGAQQQGPELLGVCPSLRRH